MGVIFITFNIKLVKGKKSVAQVSAGCLQILCRVYGYGFDAGGFQGNNLHRFIITIHLIFNMKSTIFTATQWITS